MNAPDFAAMNAIHEAHWANFMDDATQKALYESWWHDDRVNFWRHQRLLAPALEVLGSLRDRSWLTVGDGAGTDAWMLERAGLGSALATDLDDAVLAETHRRGHITRYQVANAEALAFADNSFDFALCKEALHHMNRPYAAIYELLRVARYAVVIIEPQDSWIDWPCQTTPTQPSYEAVGNYVYAFSARELEKIAFGLNLRGIATRTLVDVYIPGCEHALRRDDDPIWQETQRKLAEAETAVAEQRAKPNYIQSVIFKSPVDAALFDYLAATNPSWIFKRTDCNPHLAGDAA